jgi:hypothetical protein
LANRSSDLIAQDSAEKDLGATSRHPETVGNSPEREEHHPGGDDAKDQTATIGAHDGGATIINRTEDEQPGTE